jgi:hypothetical protein
MHKYYSNILHPKQKIIWIIAGVIFIIACVLRLYKFEEFVTFLGDQGRDAIIAKRIVTLENLPAIGAPSSVGQIYLGPFYYYLIAIFLPLFGFNPVGLAYAVTCMWLLGIAAIWYLMYRKLGAAVSLLLLILISFSASFIELSRFSWNPNLLPIFSFFTLYFFYRWMTARTWWYALLLGSFLAFSIQLHYLALLLFPTIGLAYLFYIVPSFKPLQTIRQSAIAIGTFLFFNVPLILFDLTHNFMNYKGFIALFTEGKVASEGSYIDQLQTTIQQFVIHTFQVTVPNEYVFIVFSLFIVFIGFIVWKLKSRFLLLHFMNLIVYIFGFAALSSSRYLHYFGPVYISAYLLIAILPAVSKKIYIRIMIVAIIACSFIYLNISRYPYFTNKPNNQIQYAQMIATSFHPYIEKQPIQMVTIPFTETDAHYRYFLELDGYDILAHDSAEQPEELFVLCFEECKPLDDPQWQIAAFQNKKLKTSWKIDRVTIYKIIHGTP